MNQRIALAAALLSALTFQNLTQSQAIEDPLSARLSEGLNLRDVEEEEACQSECAPSSVSVGIELASLESAILRPPKVIEAAGPEPRSQVRAQTSAPDPRRNPWLFLQLRQYSGMGINRGSLHATSLDIGAGVPMASGRLSLQLGFAIGFGAYRDVFRRVPLAYMELGFFADTLVHLNLSGPARVFLVGGTRLSMGGPLVHEEGPDEEECPSLVSVEGSFGLGSEFTWGRQGRVSMSVRGVRRRALSELVFSANGENPPVSSTRGAWGLAATIQFGAHFN